MEAYSTPNRPALHGRLLVPTGKLHRMDIPPANGHQVIVVWCNRCGHEGKVAPELWNRAKRRHCRMCGSREYSHRIVWLGGARPDNVVPFSRWRSSKT